MGGNNDRLLAMKIKRHRGEESAFFQLGWKRTNERRCGRKELSLLRYCISLYLAFLSVKRYW